MSHVLLFSGGLDSFIAYHWYKSSLIDVTPIYIDYNGKYCKKEMKSIRELIPETEIIEHVFNFSQKEIGEKCYIPNRNIYLASIAAEYGSTVILGGLKDDNVGDKSERFCHHLSETLSCSIGERIRVTSPFWNMEKVEIIDWFLNDFKGSKESLLKTVSCYAEKEHYCGKCPSCFRKACALNYNGFNLPFYNLDLASYYFLNKDSFPEKRKVSIEQFCKKLGVY